MKHILSILAFTLMSNLTFPQDCDNAIKRAEQDFSNQNYSLHSVRFFPPENVYFDVLRIDYKIAWYFTDSLDYYDCYDSIMRIRLREKFGEDLFEIAGVKADSLRNSGQWRKNAEYPGGQKELFKFIYSKLSDLTFEIDTIKTRLVVQLLIDSTGQVSEIKVVRGVNQDVDNKIKTIFMVMPKWDPAFNYGKPINQIFTVPIKLELK